MFNDSTAADTCFRFEPTADHPEIRLYVSKTILLSLKSDFFHNRELFGFRSRSPR